MAETYLEKGKARWKSKGWQIVQMRRGTKSGPTHDLARTLLPLDLRGYYFISQGALAHH